jgi:hypothetical protein
MRSILPLMLAVLLATITAPVVRAQSPTTFTYHDADGNGVLTMFDLGPDEATGGRQVKIGLTQNGVSYLGSGITLQLQTTSPYTTLITFALADPRGGSYYFQGKMISGITLSGQGTYHVTGHPENKATWSIVLGGGGGGPTSGIEGVAMAGPIYPVERPGVPNTRALPYAVITIQPAGGGAEIARQQADQNGKFRIPLAPGNYLIVPLPPQPGAVLPRGNPQSVTVSPGAFVNVVVQYDTGIR